MKLVAITEHYPATFKTYYDTHFKDLLRRGHDLRVLAGGRFGHALNTQARQWGLDDRTTYYPTTLRTLPRAAAPAFRALATRAWFRMPAGRSLKTGIVSRARLAMLRELGADVVVVHALIPGVAFKDSKHVLPDVPHGLYYHGGEVPGVRAVPDARAAEAFDNADHVFTNTAFSAQHAVDRGCPREKITLMPVGFDLGDYPDPGPRLPTGPLRLLSAGRMSEEKGFHHALEAVGILRERGVTDLHYTLTGGANDYRARLEAIVERHGLGNQVTFAGTVTTDSLIDMMRDSDVLLLPSLHIGNWAENQAAAVQEAMLMRCLAVTTSTGGVPESVPTSMLDFQVPPADPAALADAIQRARKLTAEQWTGYTDAGRAFVVENYDIRRLNDLLLQTLLGP